MRSISVSINWALKWCSMTKNYDCAVIGHWHLAFVTAACLASIGHKVVLVNTQNQKWTEFPPMPVHEPGVPEMIKEGLSKNLLDFANGYGDWSAPKVWMAVDTPVDDQDRADTGPLLEIAKNVKCQNFIISSQIPLGFCQQLEKEFGFKVSYLPENLRLGKGIETFKMADRTVIGSTDPKTSDEIEKFLSGFSTTFLKCNLPTSEMVKHANNVFLAMSISFANELARLGEKFGVDGNIVGQALKMDKRIGTGAYVSPGLGFAGGTLPRDLRTLQKLGGETKTPMRIVDSVLSVNEDTNSAILEIIEAELKKRNQPHGPVLILGYTYKADTDTLRRSQSLEIAERLQAKGVRVLGFDPFMNGKLGNQLQGKIEHFETLEQVPSAQVIALFTARPAFKEINWSKLPELQKAKPLILDTQNHLPKAPALSAGFPFKKLWSPSELPT